MALIATKFRDGEEPAPRMLEISFVDFPWSVVDVTADIDAGGEAERLRVEEVKSARIATGVAILLEEIDRRLAAREPLVLKTKAAVLLMAASFLRKDSLAIIADDRIQTVPRKGKGQPLELHRRMK